MPPTGSAASADEPPTPPVTWATRLPPLFEPTPPRGLANGHRKAEGILMERFGIDEDRAFDYLRRISSVQNRKLVLIAEDLVRTRKLPQVRQPNPPVP